MYKWAFKQNLSSSNKLLLLALVASAKDQTVAACLTDLEQKTGLNKKTILYGLNQLVELGLIEQIGTVSGKTKPFRLFKLKKEIVPKTDLSIEKDSTKNGPNISPKTDLSQQKDSTKNGPISIDKSENGPISASFPEEKEKEKERSKERERGREEVEETNKEENRPFDERAFVSSCAQNTVSLSEHDIAQTSTSLATTSLTVDENLHATPSVNRTSSLLRKDAPIDETIRSQANSAENGGGVKGKRAADAEVVLNYLNVRARRNYRPVDANIEFIIARFKEGFTVDDFKAVIDCKVREWENDPKFSKFLRPATLFSKTNFAQYSGEVPMMRVINGTKIYRRPI